MNNPTSTTLPLLPPQNQKPLEEEDLGSLSYRQLVFRKFRKSKLGLVGVVLLLLLYGIAILAEFFAPFDASHNEMRLRYVPPQGIHFFDESGFHIVPFVYGLKETRNPDTLELSFTQDKEKRYPIHLFHHGDPYRWFGLISTDLHLIGSNGPFYIFGTDRMGRDLFSRILYGARVSLTVGLVGVFVSIILGSLLGTASGYWGGAVDMVIQRIIELLSSFPAIPLWMALAAALPPRWSGLQVYFGITLILSLLGWGGLARQVRGKIMSLREADYVLAARSAGASNLYILLRHLLPTAYSHIIVVATLSIPGMILGETALSFLGLGIRPPLVSWGVLLEDSQRVTVVLNYPWLMIPALPVILTVIAFNFAGDALRDAADPYG